MAWNIPSFTFESLLSALKLNILQANFDALFKSDTSKGVPLTTMMVRTFTGGSQAIGSNSSWYPAIGAYSFVAANGGRFGYTSDSHNQTNAPYFGSAGLIITDGNEFRIRASSTAITTYYQKFDPNSGSVTAAWTDPLWSVGEVPVQADKIEQIFENFEAIGEGYTASGIPPNIINFDWANATHGSVSYSSSTYHYPADGIYIFVNLSGHWSIFVSGAWRQMDVVLTNIDFYIDGGVCVCDGTNQRYYARNTTTAWYIKI